MRIAADKQRTVELPLGTIPSTEGQFPFIAALDPGGTTGWALYNPITGIVRCGQIGPGPHHLELDRFLNNTFVETMDADGIFEVVCEEFDFRNSVDKDKLELVSREYIGVVNLFNQTVGVPVFFENASSALWFIKDIKLKKMGWYEDTVGLPHARDALRHLLKYMISQKKVRSPVTDKWFER